MRLTHCKPKNGDIAPQAGLVALAQNRSEAWLFTLDDLPAQGQRKGLQTPLS